MGCICQSHRDCHPFMPQHGTEASLSSAAGTSCAAALVAASHHSWPLGPQESCQHNKVNSDKKNGA